ncbi:hypothetical protein B0H10DRAFT_2208233 [Mycena sp. CBHHK59/15]|nr:hypothetical protein B0H10DRAFT_2208233 [Mycena sp. CBHHK59/15]
MSATSLPPGLWDLTISRLCPRPTGIRMGRLGFAHSARNSAQAALAKSPSSPPLPYSLTSAENGDYRGTLGLSRRTAKSPGPLTPRSGRPTTGPIAEIERRVQELKEAADAEVLASGDLVFSEDQLLAMYEDLLAFPPEDLVPTVDTAAEERAQTDRDLETVRELEQKLRTVDSGGTTRDSPLVAKLRGDLSHPVPSFDVPVVDERAEVHRRVLQLANARIDRVDVLHRLQPSPSTFEPSPFPIVLFSMQEYEALARACVSKGDIDAAESVLNLMKRSGITIPDILLTTILHTYTDAGSVIKAEQLLANYLPGPPTDPQRHLHVKCHLKATPSDRIPESALTVLHSYETQGHPAPMKTYTSMIASLFSTRLSLGRAQAWDLFSHMRYVAHPKPDIVLYTSMIRACASPMSTSRSSDPERALDLWTEMTVDQGLKPTVGSYNAVILACARSGRKMYVNEAFRLAKEMLDSHRDAYGQSAYQPDRRTLCALLEGAKRIGDLARARWILADLVRSEAGNNEKEGVNEEIMMHVFQTYASYVPPFARNRAMLVPGREPPSSSSIEGREIEAVNQPANVPRPGEASQRFTRVPPQTRSEVVEEVEALFQRILEDTGKDDLFAGQKKFRNVQFSVRLVNSYLAVHYQHASLEASEALFWKVFDDVGVVPDARSYLEALERCAISRRDRDRSVNLRFAEKAWSGWKALEDAPHVPGRPFDARMVERAHVAFMRVLTLNGQLERALTHIKAFAERYPPSHLHNRSPNPSLRSTRTVLVGARPLVRLTSPNEVLHHRLVAASMWPEVGYIKYISKAYEWALRGRRDAAMKARPAPNTRSITAA